MTFFVDARAAFAELVQLSTVSDMRLDDTSRQVRCKVDGVRHYVAAVKATVEKQQAAAAAAAAAAASKGPRDAGASSLRHQRNLIRRGRQPPVLLHRRRLTQRQQPAALRDHAPGEPASGDDGGTEASSSQQQRKQHQHHLQQLQQEDCKAARVAVDPAMQRRIERLKEELADGIVAMRDEEAELADTLRPKRRRVGGGGGGGAGDGSRAAAQQQTHAAAKTEGCGADEEALAQGDHEEEGEGGVEEGEEDGEERQVTGVPIEVRLLRCADPLLRARMEEEFGRLDVAFREMQEGLRTMYADVVDSPLGGWSQEEHHAYLQVGQQYRQGDAVTRRTQYWNYLALVLPGRRCQELWEHMRWHARRRAYLEQRRALARSWREHRDEHLRATREAFAKCEEVARQAVDAMAEQQRLNALRAKLYERLLELRRDKMDRLAREHAERCERLQREEEELREEELRERERRAADKAKVDSFKQKRRSEQRARDQAEARRKAELRREADEQRPVRQERVRYRQEERAEKLEQSAQAKQAKEMERLRVEDQLERLRQLARDKTGASRVTLDPLRVQQATVSYEHKVDAARDAADAGHLLREHTDNTLYPIHGYDERILTKDKRLRIANELHRAGVRGEAAMQYMSHVIGKLPGPQPVRRDTMSNVFQNSELAR